MKRPFYETPNDLIKERAAIAPLISLWDCEFHKTKRAYTFDFCATRGKGVLAASEVKCRPDYTYAQMDRIGGIFISTHKLMGLRVWLTTFGLPVIIVAQMADGLFTYTIHPEDVFPKFPVVIGGRTDRNDPEDMEPCATIPMSLFSRRA